MTTTSTLSTAMIFYDIAMRPPVTTTCCGPNPSKSRLALKFKDIPYSTSWVQLPDITKVRRGLSVRASRKFADGTDFYTLPMLSDPSTNSIIGDSFDIAVYLEKSYPNSGAGDLFPPQRLDFVFGHDLVLLAPLSKQKGATAEATKAEFVRRAGVASWDDFVVSGEERENLKNSVRDVLADLAKLFLRDASGPFLLGKQASYADFIVGGWLRMMRGTLLDNEWEEARGWHGGVFGRLHDALEKYTEVK